MGFQYQREVEGDRYVVEKPPRKPMCGEDFCDSCGDCLHCYADDPCVSHGDGEHLWVDYLDAPAHPTEQNPEGRWVN